MLLLALPSGAPAQTFHGLDAGREAALAGCGLATHGISFLLRSTADERPPHTVDLAHVPKIDRLATRHWSIRAHRSSNILMGVGCALSVAAPIIGQRGDRPLLPLAIQTESLLIATGLTNMAKHAVRRPRPYLFNADVPSTLYRGRDDRSSFWSGHTASIASLTFSTACMIDRSNADDAAKCAAWAGAAAVPTLMGYLRVRAGRHFPTDVLTGFVVGTLVGLAVPYIHRTDEGSPGN